MPLRVVLLPAFLCPSEIEWQFFFIRSDLQRLMMLTSGYSTADRLSAPTLRTQRILKRALTLLAAELFTRGCEFNSSLFSNKETSAQQSRYSIDNLSELRERNGASSPVSYVHSKWIILKSGRRSKICSFLCFLFLLFKNRVEWKRKLILLPYFYFTLESLA